MHLEDIAIALVLCLYRLCALVCTILIILPTVTDASSNEDGASTVAIAADQQQIQEQEGLDQRQKVLDDGHEKQDMVKWREANVVGNDAASADERESHLAFLCAIIVVGFASPALRSKSIHTAALYLLWAVLTFRTF